MEGEPDNQDKWPPDPKDWIKMWEAAKESGRLAYNDPIGPELSEEEKHKRVLEEVEKNSPFVKRRLTADDMRTYHELEKHITGPKTEEYPGYAFRTVLSDILKAALEDPEKYRNHPIILQESLLKGLRRIDEKIYFNLAEANRGGKIPDLLSKKEHDEAMALIEKFQRILGSDKIKEVIKEFKNPSGSHFRVIDTSDRNLNI